MKANQASFRVTAMCRAFRVSRSGYYAWCSRAPSARAKVAEQLSVRIIEAHVASRETYGAPRLRAELAAEGIRVGRKRVARLMRVHGLEGAHRRRGWKTTVRAKDARPAPDLVDRKFTVDGPNQLWVADITY